jgi:hypothetical protein
VVGLAIDFLLLLVLGVTGALGVSGLPKVPPWLWWPAFWTLVGLGAVIYLNRRHERWATRVLFGTLAAMSILAPVAINGLLAGRFGALSVGPIPKGTPVNLIMNMDPEKGVDVARGVVAMAKATVRIKKAGLREEAAYRVFAETAGPALLKASKCPDFVLDRGHWFGEALTDQEKEELIAFLKTL